MLKMNIECQNKILNYYQSCLSSGLTQEDLRINSKLDTTLTNELIYIANLKRFNLI